MSIVNGNNRRARLGSRANKDVTIDHSLFERCRGWPRIRMQFYHQDYEDYIDKTNLAHVWG
jgi:hypothetical protein